MTIILYYSLLLKDCYCDLKSTGFALLVCRAAQFGQFFWIYIKLLKNIIRIIIMYLKYYYIININYYYYYYYYYYYVFICI